MNEAMTLEILLPSRVFARRTDVLRIVAETAGGALGILPRRLDCVAALVPGILTYATASGGEIYMAVDEGILVKTGLEVRISARNAIAGTDLAGLQEAVDREFRTLDERERKIQDMLTKLDAELTRHLVELSR